MKWEQKQSAHRLQQIRARQLGEPPPVPARRPRRIPSMATHPSILGEFRLIWFCANRRQALYREMIHGV